MSVAEMAKSFWEGINVDYTSAEDIYGL
jgi:hypothetical protein